MDNIIAIDATADLGPAIEVLNIEYGITNSIVFRYTNSKRHHRAQIREASRRGSYFMSYGRRHYLADFIKTNSPWAGSMN